MTKYIKLFVFCLITLFSCTQTTKTEKQSYLSPDGKMTYTEAEILQELDLAAKGSPSKYYPPAGENIIRYNFFLDLEKPYGVVASSRIHLYADSSQWVIVFESAAYETRGGSGDITLYYVGNCITYNSETHPPRKYISNINTIPIISSDEYERISGKDQFELISADAKEIRIRDTALTIEHDPEAYSKRGIKFRDYDNPLKLISYGDILRYLNETNLGVISATEEEIKKYIPGDLPKIMIIDAFHFMSLYADKELLPSQQETYQLLAKVLVGRDPKYWKPTLKANNHWSNWTSGNL